MFQQFLFLIGLLFSIYGLSCVISSVILWFTTEKQEEKIWCIIPAYSKDLVKGKVFALSKGLRNSGMAKTINIVVVNCALQSKDAKELGMYLEKKNIGFCDKGDLWRYLENTSFQNKENTV